MTINNVMTSHRLMQVLNIVDPTHTITLRAQFIADINRRYRNLMNAIRISIVDNNALGLDGTLAQLEATPARPGQFAFLRNPQKVTAFNVWLNKQERQSVLEIIPGPAGVPEPYSNQYIRSSYQKGLDKNLRELRKKGINVPATIIPGAASGVGGAFFLPIHQETVELIYTRMFSELEGITAAMDAQISEVLASGLIEGIGPEEMARRINNRVEKVGRTRSRMIARTEVVETFNQAFVIETKRIGAAIGEEIFIQWQTAEDERVRSSHRVRNGKIFTQEEFLQLIGEPNCRCTGLPVIPSIDGEVELSSAGTFL